MIETRLQLCDNHCHFHPETTTDDAVKFATILNKENANSPFCKYFFHLMTTQHIDIECLDVLLSRVDNKDIIVPYFGVHPWFSHLFYTGDTKPNKIDHYSKVLKPTPSDELLSNLPEPMSIHQHTKRSMEIIEKHNLKVFGIGEIGLDKLFRVPDVGFLGNPKSNNIANDNGNKLPPPEKVLSKSRVTIQHQMDIFNHQLEFAQRMDKQVSIHCVKAHGALFEEVMKYSSTSSKKLKSTTTDSQAITSTSASGLPPLRVILHSYTGSIDQAKRWVKEWPKDGKLFFSLSNWINGSEDKEETLKGLMDIVSLDQILTESDIPVDRLFIEDKTQEYLDHLLGIYEKLNVYRLIKSDQIESNMLSSINVQS